jgi:hypothetical protein
LFTFDQAAYIPKIYTRTKEGACKVIIYIFAKTDKTCNILACVLTTEKEQSILKMLLIFRSLRQRKRDLYFVCTGFKPAVEKERKINILFAYLSKQQLY